MIARLSHLLVLLLAATAQAKKKKIQKPKITVMPKHLQLCKGKAPLHPKKDNAKLSWLIEASGDASLTFASSPQHQAACWILYDDAKQSAGRSKQLFLQRFALTTLHISSTKSNTTVWDWPLAADEPNTLVTRGHWGSTKHHECSWYGVHCNFNKKVERIDLGFLKLDGLIPRELALLTGLHDLDLHANDLQGVVPTKMLESLPNLKALRLHMNGFFGALPQEVENLEKLQDLILFGNYLSGAIPTVIANLNKLEVLDLYANNFAGRIPTHLGKLKKLTYLDLHDNDLTGPMPSEICKLPKLKTLIADCLGPRAEVQCDCCTICCKGAMDGTYERKCVDMKSGQEIR
mmetsp:Transcript_1483/g.2056  ORF Transcript_1483/g.2056 Transcript_1483/m.2056 type:complete len:347 (-) Transcript_1483:111-1151(-)|eukprot:CAMPEP_0198145702 /NCGR_PEP_ID=MMETSP1443-20131203/24852_1 /TAXON_ID=186043 /ORGANISM="Entomoneis sp., Strain CCMP2396" /LENGTH=346 /DNA_ID=CAMNT_0043809403 /DNA_START=126 /DNA_END=1166 /DNA_ORIENTATION=-